MNGGLLCRAGGRDFVLRTKMDQEDDLPVRIIKTSFNFKHWKVRPEFRKCHHLFLPRGKLEIKLRYFFSAPRAVVQTDRVPEVPNYCPFPGLILDFYSLRLVMIKES